MIAFHVIAASVTDTGLVRSENQDSLVMRGEAGLWAVADGMGGLADGKWASEQVAAALSTAQLNSDFDVGVRAIGAAIEDANGHIARSAENSGLRMGTTVAVLFLSGARFAVLWAGDSRVYLYRRSELILLTLDHTCVQELVDAGALLPEEAKRHPSVHVLSRAVGVEYDLKLDAVADGARVHDVFLLCSDGLTGPVLDEEIADALARFPPSEAVRYLLNLALSRGAPDNVTIVVVRCEETKVSGMEPCDV
jgi:serine/threonine protein phosphatase Stp1